jgi:peptidoglycan/LPS O-acetylase OafA/YrhL
MTPASGTGPPVARTAEPRTDPAVVASPSIGFGPGPIQPAPLGPHGPRPEFRALTGLSGLAVPFVLAFALRTDLARLGAPAVVQHLGDGGFVLVGLFLVLAGFHLCRPLTGILAGTGTPAAGLARSLIGRIAPLHLTAWAITVGLLLSEVSRQAVWSWGSSALLLNGIVGPPAAGYPVSWSVSVALGAALLLIGVALALTRPTGRRTGRRHTRLIQLATTRPSRTVSWIALTAAAIGTGLLLTGADGTATTGRSAVGQGLLGLGTGILTFRMLEGCTGTCTPPLPGTAPVRRAVPGLAGVVALGALLGCVYRSDLLDQLHVLPVFPICAGLVLVLASPQHSVLSPVHRLLEHRLIQWLGSRALALYLLHGPVQLVLDRIGEQVGLDRESALVICAMLVAVPLGSLAAAEIGHRRLEHLLIARPAPEAIRPPVTMSLNRLPRSRPERISLIDQKTIPTELRLLPLPGKPASSATATKSIAQKDDSPS